MSKRFSRVAQPILNPPGLFQSPAPVPIADDYEDPSLALVCQKCGAPVDAYDATGGAWCDGCDVRRRAMNHGYYAAWPQSRAGRVTIAAGQQGWQGFALGAPVAVLAALLATLVEGEVAA